MRAVTASIVHEDPYMAGRDAVAEILDQLGPEREASAEGSPGTPAHASPKLDVVLAFVSSRCDPERALAGMWSRLPPATRLVGCSSFAEIGAEDALVGSVTAMGMRLDRVEYDLFVIECSAWEESHEVGRRLGEQMLGFDPVLVIVLPDGSMVNSPQLILGMQGVLGTKRTIVGGVAADHIEYQQTFELFDRRVLRNAVVALALRGPIEVATSAKAGFQPVGVERTCTLVEDDKLILELDGVSALGLYKEMLGPDIIKRPSIGIEFPLAVILGSGGDYMSSDYRSHLIRVVRKLDEERGGLLCGTDIHTGARVRMTTAAKDDLLDAAILAIAEAKHKLPSPAIALLFSCAGRRLVLGSRHHEEIKGAFSVLGSEVPRIGFYTFGEIAPVDGVTRFHSETFTVTLLGVK